MNVSRSVEGFEKLHGLENVIDIGLGMLAGIDSVKERGILAYEHIGNLVIAGNLVEVGIVGNELTAVGKTSALLVTEEVYVVVLFADVLRP